MACDCGHYDDIAIVAHIYIGSVGMEGAFDAMGNGQVDPNGHASITICGLKKRKPKVLRFNKLETYDEDDVSSVCFYRGCICRRLFRAE